MKSPRPTRILFLDHTAAIGGGEVALLNLLTHLDRNRYEPVVGLFANGPLVDRLRAEGIETRLITLPHSVIQTPKESLRGRGLLRIGAVASIAAHVWQL